eukprot:1047498-Prorocentrum_lima.AAC.1
MELVPGAAVAAAEPPDAEMDVFATGIAASDHPGPKPGMAVFRRVQQRAAVPMPYVYEEDSTVFANAAG